MQIIADIKHIFFPNICLSCDTVLINEEKTICSYCIHELPFTNYTLTNSLAISRLFYGRVSLEKATALLFFKKKGKVQHLIHNLKYKNNQEIGTFLGEWIGNEMKESGNYTNIDFIIPVPLHKKRFKSRGYNQLTKFGIAISNILNTTYNTDILLKKSFNKTQTKKGRLDRLRNIDELFYLKNKELFENKHILLLDDIITTGATIEACSLELLKIKNIKISLAVMAITV